MPCGNCGNRGVLGKPAAYVKLCDEDIAAIGGGGTIQLNADSIATIRACDPAAPEDCDQAFFVNIRYDNAAGVFVYTRADSGTTIPVTDFVPCTGECGGATEPQTEVNVYEVCDSSDPVTRYYVREVYDEDTATVTYVRIDTGALVTPVTDFVICPSSPLQSCEFCDDVNGDGSVIEPFTRYFYINADGTTTTFADTQFVNGLGQPYAPIGTVVRCEDVGNNFTGSQQRLEVLDGAGTWTRPSDFVTGVSITVAGVGDPLNPPTITDANGTVPLIQGLSMSWNQATTNVPWLVNDFTITASTGDVIYINWVEYVI